ncbi:hypothetical protein A3739_13175 [Oleiphilus sp. HI0067]|nr:hypothetical protein A3739_13175 [Oleiphilus sp. HI0067]
MRLIFTLIIMSVVTSAHAFKPSYCDDALSHFAIKLQAGDKLGNPSSALPNDDYKYGHLPNICILFGMKEARATNWLAHKSKNASRVILEERVIETLQSNYYGPFDLVDIRQ